MAGPGRGRGEAPTRPTNLQTGACRRGMEGRRAGRRWERKRKCEKKKEKPNQTQNKTKHMTQKRTSAPGQEPGSSRQHPQSGPRWQLGSPSLARLKHRLGPSLWWVVSGSQRLPPAPPTHGHPLGRHPTGCLDATWSPGEGAALLLHLLPVAQPMGSGCHSPATAPAAWLWEPPAPVPSTCHCQGPRDPQPGAVHSTCPRPSAMSS